MSIFHISKYYKNLSDVCKSRKNGVTLIRIKFIKTLTSVKLSETLGHNDIITSVICHSHTSFTPLLKNIKQTDTVPNYATFNS